MGIKKTNKTKWMVIWCDGVMGCGGLRFRVGPGLPITHANTQAHTHTQKGQDILENLKKKTLNRNFNIFSNHFLISTAI